MGADYGFYELNLIYSKCEPVNGYHDSCDSEDEFEHLFKYNLITTSFDIHTRDNHYFSNDYYKKYIKSDIQVSDEIFNNMKNKIGNEFDINNVYIQTVTGVR